MKLVSVFVYGDSNYKVYSETSTKSTSVDAVTIAVNSSMSKTDIANAMANAISSESTLRDADMVSEMAGFTKTNILAQAAQSMLAQSNQSASNVLGLLQ